MRYDVALIKAIWRPERQSDVTAKIIEAFEWLFLIRLAPQLFLWLHQSALQVFIYTTDIKLSNKTCTTDNVMINELNPSFKC